jgi:hypothetical protein
MRDSCKMAPRCLKRRGPAGRVANDCVTDPLAC